MYVWVQFDVATRHRLRGRHRLHKLDCESCQLNPLVDADSLFLLGRESLFGKFEEPIEECGTSSKHHAGRNMEMAFGNFLTD